MRSKKVEVRLYVEEAGEELELLVTGTVTPLVRGRRYGENSCPDEGGDCEIESVTLNGVEYGRELTDVEQARAEEAMWEELCE